MSSSARSPFDPSLDGMREMGAEVVDLVARFIDERYGAVSSDYSGMSDLLQALAAAPPQEGRPLADLLETIRTAADKGFDTANPGFVGYIPGGGLYASALADFIACAVNRYTGIAAPAPALVQMEAAVLRWICDLFGFPEGSQGILTPGGSMSTLSAVVAARSTLLGDDFQKGTIYVSDEVHHSVAKAARFAGFPADAVQVIASDGALRMDLDSLADAVAVDGRRGRKPFMVVGTAGTINTGAVDPLAGIAETARDAGLWFHVDGAYGGFFQLTERGRERFRGIEQADSITLDPHKALFLPYGTGCLIVRDREALRAANAAHAHYLPTLSDDHGPPDFSSFSPELTRDFRGLRLWLPLHLHGVQAFVRALDEKLDLARLAFGELSSRSDLDVPWPPELSLVAFRPRGATDEQAEALLARINGSGRMWLSTAPIRGKTYLRMCILSHRSHPDRIREGLSIIGTAAAERP